MRKFLILMSAWLFVFSLLGVNHAFADTKTTVKTVKTDKAAAADDDPTVYVTPNGKKYHKKNCKQAAVGKSGIKLSEALLKDITACKLCKPPEAMFYVNPNGKKFHKKNCTMVKKDAVAISPEDTQKNKLEACKLCMAPKPAKKK